MPIPLLGEATPAQGPFRSARRCQKDDKIVFMHTVEEDPGLFFKQIAVDRLPAQQVDTVSPLLFFFFHGAQFGGQFGNPELIFVVGLKATLTVDGVPNEIAADAAGNAVEHKRKDDAAQTRPDNHDAYFGRGWLAGC
jgi:hypothetical protein